MKYGLLILALLCTTGCNAQTTGQAIYEANLKKQAELNKLGIHSLETIDRMYAQHRLPAEQYYRLRINYVELHMPLMLGNW